jgi:hypothetical protein
MPKNPIPEIVRISEVELRKLFNDNYLDDILAGRIQAIVNADRHPSLPLAKEPFCTYSQEISYVDPTTNQEVARAHQYLRPDGTLGLSGLPDPKRVYLNGLWYRITKQKNRLPSPNC